MNNQLFVKCIKDTEGYWTEGKVYPGLAVNGGFVLVGDDEQDGENWIATPTGCRKDGTVIYRLGDIEGEFCPTMKKAKASYKESLRKSKQGRAT